MTARDELLKQAQVYEEAARVIRKAIAELDAGEKPAKPFTDRPVRLREPEVDAPLTAIEGN